MIKISGRPVKLVPIQWSDRERKNPISFMVTCPFCKVEQWVTLSKLYIGSDNSKLNHQCRNCDRGTEPRGGWPEKPKVTPKDVFKPKMPGWRSIYK